MTPRKQIVGEDAIIQLRGSFEVGEVTLSKDDPLSVDLKMFPDTPTTTKQPLLQLTDEEVVVVPEELELLDESSFFAQEMRVRLKRKRERMMSRCFTWFPIGGLGEPNIYHDSGVFYKKWGFYLEELGQGCRII